MTNAMDLVLLLMKTKIAMKAIGNMIWKVEKEHIFTLQGIYIQDFFKKISVMVKEKQYIKMAVYIKVNIIKIKFMDTDIWKEITLFMKANSAKVLNKVLVF